MSDRHIDLVSNEWEIDGFTFSFDGGCVMLHHLDSALNPSADLDNPVYVNALKQALDFGYWLETARDVLDHIDQLAGDYSGMDASAYNTLYEEAQELLNQSDIEWAPEFIAVIKAHQYALVSCIRLDAGPSNQGFAS